MCWESTKPSPPSEDGTDYGNDPVVGSEEVPEEETGEEPTGPCEEWRFGPEDFSEHIVETIENAPSPYEAWNGVYTWDSKFNVDVARQDCAITVTVRLKVEGTITTEQLNAWKDAIEAKWNGKVIIICEDPACPAACPAGYSVFINVVYVDGDEHYVVTAQTPDATSGGIAGLNGTTGMQGWGVEDVIDITHEFGHMLGNPEEYFTTNNFDYTYGGTAQGWRDPNGGIMNNPANDPLPNNYYLIAEKAAALMGAGVTARVESL